MTTKCPFCGNSNEDIRITCSQCGAVLRHSEDAVRFLREPPSVVRDIPPSQKTAEQSPCQEKRESLTAQEQDRAVESPKEQAEEAKAAGPREESEPLSGETKESENFAQGAGAFPGFFYPPFFGYPPYPIPTQLAWYGPVAPWPYPYFPYVYPGAYPHQYYYYVYPQPAPRFLTQQEYVGHPTNLPKQNYPQPYEQPIEPRQLFRPDTGQMKMPFTRRKSFWIAMIVIFLLIFAGAAGFYFFYLKGKAARTFDLGNATVVGANIEFKDMTLTQKGDVLTLKGKYENDSKREGTVTVTLDATSPDGTGEILSFDIPVEGSSSQPFSKTITKKISIKSLSVGALILSSGSSSDTYQSYPWVEEMERESQEDSGNTNSDTSTESSSTYPYGSSNSGVPNYSTEIPPSILEQMQSNPELLRYLQNPQNQE